MFLVKTVIENDQFHIGLITGIPGNDTIDHETGILARWSHI